MNMRMLMSAGLLCLFALTGCKRAETPSETNKDVAEARSDATTQVAEARKDAESAGARIVAEAQEEAARRRERTIAEIEAAKRVALSELANKSTDVAMTLAQRIVGREVKAADHQNLIQDTLSQLPSHN